MFVITVANSSHRAHRQVRQLAEKIAKFIKYDEETGKPKVNRVAIYDESVKGEMPAPPGTDVYVIIKKKIADTESYV